MGSRMTRMGRIMVDFILLRRSLMGTQITRIERIKADFILLRRISDLCILSVLIRLISVISVPI
jgi:hypothetical protein